MEALAPMSLTTSVLAPHQFGHQQSTHHPRQAVAGDQSNPLLSPQGEKQPIQPPMIPMWKMVTTHRRIPCGG